MREMFNSQMLQLTNESSTLHYRIDSTMNRLTRNVETLTDLTTKVEEGIRSKLNRIKPDLYLSRLNTMKMQIELQTKQNDLHKMELEIESSLSEILKFQQENTTINGKLIVVQREIDDWMQKKIRWADKKLHRGLKDNSNEVRPVRALKVIIQRNTRLISSAKSKIKELTQLIESTSEWYPHPIKETFESLIKTANHLYESSEIIKKELKRFEIADGIQLPTSFTEWSEVFVTFLLDRESNLQFNLQLTKQELRIASTFLFDDLIQNNGFIKNRIDHEFISFKTMKEMMNHSIDYTVFDVRKLRKKNHSYSGQFAQATKRWVRSLLDEKEATEFFDLIEKREEKVEQHIENLRKEMSNKVQRHFKNDLFSALLISSYEIPESKYIQFYKSGWHKFPNFHLHVDEIKQSDKSHDDLDELIKTPIRHDLFLLCLNDDLTKNQAIMLQDMDKEGTLFKLTQSYDISLDLVFALYGKEHREWYKALLQNPELCHVIEEVRHDQFNPHIWDCVITKNLTSWQYICIMNLSFESEEILKELSQADDVWEELTEYYVNMFDLSDEFARLVRIYQPTAQTEKKTLSLTDIIEAVEPISEFTVRENSSRSRKKKRKKRGRFSF